MGAVTQVNTSPPSTCSLLRLAPGPVYGTSSLQGVSLEISFTEVVSTQEWISLCNDRHYAHCWFICFCAVLNQVPAGRASRRQPL